jgi:hypothetical protein
MAHVITAGSVWEPSDGLKAGIAHVLTSPLLAISDGLKGAIVHVIAAFPSVVTRTDGLKCSLVHSITAAVVKPSDGLKAGIVHDLSGRQGNAWHWTDAPAATGWKWH